MNNNLVPTNYAEGFEPDRYELRETPWYSFQTDRRDFFRFLGGGLVVLLAVGELSAQESGSRGQSQEAPHDIGAWLHITENGEITAYTGKVEMGQNIRTSLAQAIGEELHTDPLRVRMVMGDTMLTPWDLGTVGSMTTPRMAPQLRQAAAASREMLLDLAAEQMQAPRNSLVVENGEVRNTATGAKVGFGALTKGRKLTQTITASAKLMPAGSWKFAGHSMLKTNAREIVTGKEKYVSDIKLPGMMYGAVVRPSAFEAKLASVDTSAAAAMPGVIAVHDGDFVGVACTDPARLPAATAAVKANWKTSPQISNKELFEHLKTHPSKPGDTPKWQPITADVHFEAEYNVSYIQHAPLEPRAAVATWEGDRLTVWTGSQRPFGIQSELARAFGIPEQKIRVIATTTGSGYGGKHTGECALEAARLAKAAGKPVKLTWTREEEFTWAYFRPAGVIQVRSGASKDGRITSWQFHNFNSGPAAIRSMYNIPDEVAEFHATDYPLRQGSYRGLAATANHFARESHMDELAHAAGIEPAAFRLKNTSDERLRKVIEAATERFRWGAAKSRNGQGRGMMAGFDKGGYVACCVEITVTGKTVKVDRMVEAFECGAVVNPEQLKNQIAGGMIMGLGGALTEEIKFANGKVLNPRFSHYRVPRDGDVPEIEVVLVDRKDLMPAGAGETPIVGVAPAIANAIFDATGKRLRSMPLRLEEA